jgi:amino acid permease
MLGGEGNTLYIALIGIAGFTGTLCWVGIIYSQILFRKRLKQRGYDPETALTVKAQWFPGLAWFAFIIQILAMVLLIFEVGDGLPIFVLSMDIIIAPIVLFQIQKYSGKIRKRIVIGADEMTFDMKFPAKPGFEDKPKKPAIEKNQSALCALLLVVTAFSIILSFYTINTNPSEIGEEYNIFTDPGMKNVWLSVIVLIVTYVVIFWGVVKLNKYKKPGSDITPAVETAPEEAAVAPAEADIKPE